MSQSIEERGGQHGEWLYATKPTRWTLFWRTFLPWQAWRFLWINAKMIRIISRGHSGRRA
jgi:hypothetical protein